MIILIKCFNISKSFDNCVAISTGALMWGPHTRTIKLSKLSFNCPINLNYFIACVSLVYLFHVNKKYLIYLSV